MLREAACCQELKRPPGLYLLQKDDRKVSVITSKEREGVKGNMRKDEETEEASASCSLQSVVSGWKMPYLHVF